MVDPIKIIDVSKWQAGLDLSQWAKTGGGLAVIAKASEGTNIRDANYSAFRTQCDSLGLGFAAYHFFRPSSPVDQASWFLACAIPDEGSRVVCDWEDDATTAANVVAFLQEIARRRPDLQLTVYSGSTAKQQLGSTRNAWLADNTSLWLAQYTTGSPSWPTATWPTWSLWQYSDKGSIPGYARAVDANRFNGPDDALLRWIGPAEEPAPAPSDVAEVAMSITSDRPIALTLSLGANVTLAGSA